MTEDNRRTTRYWGSVPPPETKREFFNAVTTPAPSGDGSIATIRMYGPIDSWGGYWGISTKDVSGVLDSLPDSVSQINLRINSPGGEVFEGIAILNLLRAHKAKVTAVVDGLAASAASIIAAGCDETVMSPGTQMMIHSPWMITWGNAVDLRKNADMLDGVERSCIEIYQAKAGTKDWAALLAAETWLTATETVGLGLADRVATIPDAGETATVGDQPIDEDDIEDAAMVIPISRFPDRVAAAVAPALQTPSSTEPGNPNRKELAMSDAFLAGVRDRLGVTDAEASEETVLTALDQALAEQADPTPTAALPEGVVAIDAAVLANLQTQAAQGAAARAEQAQTRRDGILDAALKDGRIAPASRAHFAALLESNEEGTTALLNSMPKNTAIPVAELGFQPPEASSDDQLYAMAWGNDTTEEV
ncbi:MAG: ATP-dependent Clp protease proteolytic subunit [Microbacterium sp.]|uniref:head maturation protease, ClpP-related n=1 Tax=Microbacterium sp. TaxID=51671 RepID=UPI001AC7E922|nr:head maturation protease, ClpP-related [Microbacterium sp.]MBN9176113.1 ATP-dependent Clp protease proteolytic subunit [Microbacterium sp.]